MRVPPVVRRQTSRNLGMNPDDHTNKGVQMTLLHAARVVRRLLDGPVARPVLLQWKREHFLSNLGHGCHYGVFESFPEARASLPQSKEFDQAPLAVEYVEGRSKKVFPYDYPMLLWLLRAF